MAKSKQVESLSHTDATRRNIPTAEQQAFVEPDEAKPKPVAYPRNTDLDPQLMWRGKDEQDWSDLVVQAPPLYIQEKIHPKVIIEDLRRQTQNRRGGQPGAQFDFFADFNGLPDEEAKLEFYQHDQNWSNRMILGDSLQVMASLAEREGLRGKVQCIYIDPPYGIKFNSNWQVSTRSRDVKDGKTDQISREPEQIRAFRDTWKDGINSYLTYLRDRLTVARDLLTESGSIFVQIGDENVHHIRELLAEVIGEENFVSQIALQKSGSMASRYLGSVADYVLWYAKSYDKLKYRSVFKPRDISNEDSGRFTGVQTPDGQDMRISNTDAVPTGYRLFAPDPLQSASMGRDKGEGAASWFEVSLDGNTFTPTPKSRWKTNQEGMERLRKCGRLISQRTSIRYRRYIDDFPASVITNIWSDLAGASNMTYVVQTATKIVQRCILMTTDPGDLVLDPTCGSGTTATVAEQWGRRWITIDTSRVALALARARLMGARYPYYLLADTPEGVAKEAEVSRHLPQQTATHGDIRQGFVYQRVPHITLKSIANNAEIDDIWEKWQAELEPLRSHLNEVLISHQEHQVGHQEHKKIGVLGAKLRDLGENKPPYEEWQIPRHPDQDWPQEAIETHAKWWQARIARQQEIDKAIADRAEQEVLYDKPYEDSSRVRVAGPFTVESLSPHRVVAFEDDALADEVDAAEGKHRPAQEEDGEFARMVLEHLRTSGVQQGDKQNRITFTSLTPWPGTMIAADGRFLEGETERKAAIFIGPEFGTVSRPDLLAAAREAAEAGFPLLIACAFNFDAHASELTKMGPLQVIRARMNPDLHMADELKNTGQGNLFVVFGEPDVQIDRLEDGQLQVRILGLDIFDPQKCEVRAGDKDDIAAWFIDTDYNEESFFVRHAYFLGASDPYRALKTTLKADIDEEAWESLYSDVSRPFEQPRSGRIAVKVINHFGDEVMKVFGA